jgi:hypothetical protein
MLGSMYFFGGGHFSYFGDDVICYDIATRTFSRVFGVSPYAQDVTYPPGNAVTGDEYGPPYNQVVTTRGGWVTAQNAGLDIPYPCHTNNGVEFVPADGGGGPLGSMVFISHWQTGVRIIQPCLWKFSLSTNTWSRGPDLPSPTVSGGDFGSTHGMAYDTKRKLLWIGSGQSARVLWVADLNTNTVREVSHFGTYANWITLSNLVYLEDIDCLWYQSQGTTTPSYWGIDLSSMATASSATSGLTKHALTIANPAIDPVNFSGQQVEAGQTSGYVNALDVPTTIYRGGSNRPEMIRLVPPGATWKTAGWTWNRETLNPKNVNETHQFEVRTNDGDLQTRARYVPILKSMVYSHGPSVYAVAARHSSFV